MEGSSLKVSELLSTFKPYKWLYIDKKMIPKTVIHLVRQLNHVRTAVQRFGRELPSLTAFWTKCSASEWGGLCVGADGKLCEGVVTSWPVTSRILSSCPCCTCLKMWSRTRSSDQQLWSSFIWSPTSRKQTQADREADKERNRETKRHYLKARLQSEVHSVHARVYCSFFPSLLLKHKTNPDQYSLKPLNSPDYSSVTASMFIL